MNKFNFKSSGTIKKICAGSLALTTFLFAGCEKNDRKVVILPSTSLVEMYDAVKDETIMDDYVESKTSVNWFDYTDLDNLEKEDMATVNERIFDVGLNQLKGMILDALGYPLELISGIRFDARTYVAEIILVGEDNSISIKISDRNLSDFIYAITAAQSGVIGKDEVKKAYDAVKRATLLTGTLENNKITFNYDSKKLESAGELIIDETDDKGGKTQSVG